MSLRRASWIRSRDPRSLRDSSLPVIGEHRSASGRISRSGEETRSVITAALGGRLAPGITSFPQLFTDDGVIEVPFDGDGGTPADAGPGRADGHG